MKALRYLATTSAVGFIAVAAFAQSGGGRGGPQGQGGESRGGQPTEAMLEACSAKVSGESCSSTGADGESISGTCRGPEDRPLACVPEGGPGGERGGGGRGGRQGGGPGGGGEQSLAGLVKLDSTQAYTLGVLCELDTSAMNDQLSEISQATWDCVQGQRTLVANAIPNHGTGPFPNAGNRNRITSQTVSFKTTVQPVAYDTPGFPVKVPGYALNGIKFDPGTAGRCDSDAASLSDCDLGRGTGEWTIEALGQDTFDFGDDDNHAHVQPTGSYHYHGIPTGMLSAANRDGKEMQLIGWAADGFPMYARLGLDEGAALYSAPRPMRSSYRIKAAPDAGRPDPALFPMGAFSQDYEFVEGLGDLDECNGRFGITPEFPDGIYHYYATDTYPFVQRCVKGSAASAPERARGGRGQRGQRGEGGRGGRGGRGGEEGGRGGGGGGRGGGGLQELQEI